MRLGIRLQLGREWQWEGVGMNVDGNGNGPYSNGKTTDFFTVVDLRYVKDQSIINDTTF